MRYRTKKRNMRIVFWLIVGLTTSLFVLSSSNSVNAEGFASHKGWFWRAEPVICGDTLMRGHFKLTRNLTCTEDPAITITGPARLNLNGYTLSGDEGGNDCILIEGNGARIWNGSVENCKDGIVITLKGKRNRISQVKSYNNKRRGFRIRGDKNLLINCSATSNGRQGFRINGDDDPLDFAKGNKIFYSKAYANCRDGIEFVVGKDNEVFYNHVEDNGNEDTCHFQAPDAEYRPWFYAGIDVTPGSEKNKIKHNYACGNLGCIGSNDDKCIARERNFWDENLDSDGNCADANEWEHNTVCMEPECTPSP